MIYSGVVLKCSFIKVTLYILLGICGAGEIISCLAQEYKHHLPLQ